MCMIAVAVGASILAAALLGDDADAVRTAVRRLGLWGPVAYLSLCVALTLVLFPFPAQAAAAGLLFGVVQGTIYAVVGGSLGALAAFGTARHYGRAPVARIVGQRMKWLLDEVGEAGFAGVLLVRVMPGVPRQAASYWCGLTSVSWRAFAAGNLVGMLPYAYAYVVLGGTLGDLDDGRSRVAVGLLLAFAVAGIVLFMWQRKRRGGHGGG